MARVSDDDISSDTNNGVTFFLTDEIEKTLVANSWFNRISDPFSEKISHQDWQEVFCKLINYHSTQIPWNLLRAKGGDLSDDIRTIVCCDPISIQMTHRGAYCWGQKPLNISQKEAVYIVDQINKVLMCDGEQFLLSDDLEWLYVSNKSRCLNEPSFERLIGKDLFDFRYQGRDANQWSHLATEIQMLIKQLMDFKKIEACSLDVASEINVSVHFWGDTDLTMEEAFPVHKKRNPIQLYSNNHKLNQFALQNNLTVKTLQDLGSEKNLNSSNGHTHTIIVASNLSEILDSTEPEPIISSSAESHSIISEQFKLNPLVKIVTQDKILVKASSGSKSFGQKMRSIYKSTKSLFH